MKNSDSKHTLGKKQKLDYIFAQISNHNHKQPWVIYDRRRDGQEKGKSNFFLNTRKKTTLWRSDGSGFCISFWIYILLSRLFCMYLLSFTTSSSSLLQHKHSLSHSFPNPSQLICINIKCNEYLKPTHTNTQHSHKCVQHLSPSPKPAFAYKQDFWLSVSPVLLLFIWV